MAIKLETVVLAAVSSPSTPYRSLYFCCAYSIEYPLDCAAESSFAISPRYSRVLSASPARLVIPSLIAEAAEEARFPTKVATAPRITVNPSLVSWVCSSRSTNVLSNLSAACSAFFISVLFFAVSEDRDLICFARLFASLDPFPCSKTTLA